MVAFPLVAAHIESGRLLLQRLQEDGFPYSLAFWSPRTDSDEWELYIASSLVPTVGIRTAYMRLNESERKLASEPAYVQAYGRVGINLQPPDNATVVALAKTLDSTPGNGDLTISRAVSHGVYIEHAYIYRLRSE